MRITVDQVGDVKRGRFGPYGSICANGSWYTVDGDPAELLDKTLDVEIRTKTARNGRSYKVAKVLQVVSPIEPGPRGTPAPAAGNKPNPVKWALFKAFASHAHKFAKELEPNDPTARVGVFTAILEAFVRIDFEIEI